MSDAVLVVGAGGAVGGAAVQALCAAGVAVRAASRTPARLTLPAGAAGIELDLDADAPLEPLLRDCSGLVLVPPAGSRAWQLGITRRLAQAAAASGVERAVLVSGFSAAHDPDSTSRALEQACYAAGLRPVCLRPNHFMQGFAREYRDQVIAGALQLYTGAGRASWIDARDIGRAAAGALLARDAAAGPHLLTGPEALTLEEVAAALSRASGRKVRCAARSPDDTRAALRALGLRPETIELSVARLREIAEGRFGTVTDAVERLGGAPPVPFEAWAREHADAWR